MKMHHTYSNIKPTANLDHLPKVRGLRYEEKFDLDRFIDACRTTGFQATHLAQAVDIARIMVRERAEIFLTCTSNMISSGVRETITHLVKQRKVACIITTAGGIEEDVIKCLKPFVLGSFDASGEYLFEEGVNRTGNILVPNDRYAEFDKFTQPFFQELHAKGTVWSSSSLAKELGLYLERLENHEESYLYWAAKNAIPVICPALMDGSLGDLVHFFRQRHKDFVIDTAADLDLLVKLLLNAEKAGGIVLGGGVAKHYLLNAAIFREGLDYTVYINTGQEFDGSDSGAKIDEAISWGKVKPRTPSVKVHCDATIAFPLVVMGAFSK